MRIIKRNTLEKFWNAYAGTEQPLKSWFAEANKAKWRSSNEMKLYFPSASVISGKRTVFNIKGNSYRLVADIEYKIGIIFIIWFGTHAEYNEINVKTISYDKSN